LVSGGKYLPPGKQAAPDEERRKEKMRKGKRRRGDGNLHTMTVHNFQKEGIVKGKGRFR